MLLVKLCWVVIYYVNGYRLIKAMVQAALPLSGGCADNLDRSLIKSQMAHSMMQQRELYYIYEMSVDLIMIYDSQDPVERTAYSADAVY